VKNGKKRYIKEKKEKKGVSKKREGKGGLKKTRKLLPSVGDNCDWKRKRIRGTQVLRKDMGWAKDRKKMCEKNPLDWEDKNISFRILK